MGPVFGRPPFPARDGVVLFTAVRDARVSRPIQNSSALNVPSICFINTYSSRLLEDLYICVLSDMFWFQIGSLT